MKKGIVNRNCTSSANKFYYLFIIFLVQSFAFGGNLVSCGNPAFGGNDGTNCAETTLCADESELHGVRCCSDAEIDLYEQYNGCDVWVESYFTTTDPDVHLSGCVREATYSEAVAICEAEGARLCSLLEVEASCTSQSGCALDQELIWTSGDCSDDVDDCVGQLDECGVCNGDGIADGTCDCAGSVDLGCGCGEAGLSGCDEACGSTAVVDECDVCDGDGSSCGECDPNAGYSAGYDDGVASVTPDDGIGQSDVDVAYAAGIASVTPEDGINQATVDAAVAIEFAAAYILGDQSGDIINSGF